MSGFFANLLWLALSISGIYKEGRFRVVLIWKYFRKEEAVKQTVYYKYWETNT
jgi:hypothetical protein